MHIGAGNIHFQRSHPGFFGQYAGQFAEVFRTGSINIGNDRHILPGQRRQLTPDEGFHAVVLEADGVKHAGRRFRHAGDGIAFPRTQGKPLHHNGSQTGDITVRHELRPVPEGSGSRHDRIFQSQRAHAFTPDRMQLDFHVHRIRLLL